MKQNIQNEWENKAWMNYYMPCGKEEVQKIDMCHWKESFIKRKDTWIMLSLILELLW